MTSLYKFRLLAAGCLAALWLTACPSTDPPADNNGGTDAGLQEDGGGGECLPECTVGTRTCGLDDVVIRCETVDGCPKFVEVSRCPSSRACEAGTCVDNDTDCTSVCTPGDEPRCNQDSEVERCDDYDDDGCFEWGGALSCPSGEFCDPQTGSCEPPTCSDACSGDETRCEGDLVRICARNAEGCYVFGAGKECPSGEVCQAGKCQPQASCDDECAAGDTICGVEGGVRTCEDIDGDGCLELSAAQSCPSSEECRGGSCVEASTCQDECIKDEAVCVGNQITTCDDHDGDGCVEFSDPTDCPAGQTCSRDGGSASCEAAPVTGTVVINEIFYDAVGQDMRGSGSGADSPVFIELQGTPGIDISGFTVELINGSNGRPYNTITIPAGSALDGNGFAVLAMDKADSYLSFAAPSYTNVYYVLTEYASGSDALQNGQDNVVLKDATGTVADAVGYGDFSTTLSNFRGEVRPAAATISGRSLGRVPGAQDTDDNAADFISFYPTPGLPNSDLLVNEVYPNQPGVDDSTQTFVELVAPILGWEDMPLDGYVLHAINGYDGQDYIFASNGAAGIDLSGRNLNDGGGSDGYVVVCNVAASASLLNVCSVTYDGADFQNGPDNFVLRYQGRRTDSVGYGTFDASETFVGEASPISYDQSDAGKSIGRWPITDPSVDGDTDDNQADFWRLSPTPGATNPRPSP